MQKLKIHRRDFRPNFLKSQIVGKTETQLTTPTSAVIIVDLTCSELSMVDEYKITMFIPVSCYIKLRVHPIMVATIYLGLVRVSLYVGPLLPPAAMTISSIRDFT
jgi:hypothetical protein